MKIYQATIEELDSVAQLFDLYRRFYGKETNITAAREFLKERLTNEESVIYIAYDNDVAVGFTQLYPSFSSLNMKRIWVLNDLYIMETVRQKGVAQKLIIQATVLAKESNASGILLETNVENVPAQNLYEKIGFQRETNHFYFLSV